VIASHYAEPIDRRIATATDLRDAPSLEAPVIKQISAGDTFAVVEEIVGWAWGYGGVERRVGYVPTEALSPRD
jgi:hypothetical protein